MSGKIDINTADAATLTTISGIGPALAERIVEYRETVHPFEEVIELAAVPGISEKMVRGFAALVTVQPAVKATAAPLDREELEDMPLLDTPEEVILLGAPDQPEALLAAELPDNDLEVAAATAAQTSPQGVEAQEEIDAAPVAEEEEVEAAAAEMAEVEEVETASVAEAEEEIEATISVPDSPEREALRPAEPISSYVPEPGAAQAAPAQPPAEWEARAQRRGCLTALVGATFGAILGAVLTLAILAAVNGGTINYASSDSQLRQQLDTEIISRTTELNQLATRVSLAATQEAAANQSLEADFAAADEAINEALDANEMIVSNLEQRLEDVAGAADTFTDFLAGLRLLLDDLDEGAATPTPAPAEATISPTPTPTPLSTDQPPPSATTAGQPTRTPQPTATPFTFPTNTPAPQP